MKYTDEAYKEAIAAVISDIHYSNASYTSKISGIRRYSEIILRRLLCYDSTKQLTLGHQVTQDKLRKKGFTEKLFVDTITSINEMGSDRTHTQVIPVATKEEYENALNGLFNLYAYLFVDYFKKNEFGSNSDIMKAFSILPSAIRYKALACLYDIYSDNIAIIDKFLLSMVKSKGLTFSVEWIEGQRERLESLTPEFSSDDYRKLIENFGITTAMNIAKEMKRNMYDVSLEKARIIGTSYKPLYTTMEEALSYYNASGTVSGSAKGIKEFNDLLHFVYMGRREEEPEVQNSIIQES